jgi:hypothetical protein
MGQIWNLLPDFTPGNKEKWIKERKTQILKRTANQLYLDKYGQLIHMFFRLSHVMIMIIKFKTR